MGMYVLGVRYYIVNQAYSQAERTGLWTQRLVVQIPTRIYQDNFMISISLTSPPDPSILKELHWLEWPDFFSPIRGQFVARSMGKIWGGGWLMHPSPQYFEKYCYFILGPDDLGRPVESQYGAREEIDDDWSGPSQAEPAKVPSRAVLNKRP